MFWTELYELGYIPCGDRMHPLGASPLHQELENLSALTCWMLRQKRLKMFLGFSQALCLLQRKESTAFHYL